jgi:hypothetical protein
MYHVKDCLTCLNMCKPKANLDCTRLNFQKGPWSKSKFRGSGCIVNNMLYPNRKHQTINVVFNGF